MNEQLTREPLCVRIDLDLEDLVPGYLENRRGDLRTMRSALDGYDLSKVRDLAHSMKGSGGGYGFDGITEIGGALEKAAIRGDMPAVERGLAELAVYLDRVMVVYE